MAGSRQNVDRRMVALDQRSAVAAQIFAVQAVDQRRCHPVGGQSSQPQIGVAEGAGHHTPRPVGFLRPADPYFYRVCGRAGAIGRTLGLCTEFSRWVGDDVAVFAASGPSSRLRGIGAVVVFVARCVVAANRCPVWRALRTQVGHRVMSAS
jgi:hypothetical protein